MQTSGWYAGLLPGLAGVCVEADILEVIPTMYLWRDDDSASPQQKCQARVEETHYLRAES